jgi:protein phosphatase inhibitor 2
MDFPSNTCLSVFFVQAPRSFLRCGDALDPNEEAPARGNFLHLFEREQSKKLISFPFVFFSLFTDKINGETKDTHFDSDRNMDIDDQEPSAVDSNENIPSWSEDDLKQVKPALIKEPKRYKASKKKHLKWDEEVIEEHDQLRGTRMKIDEPNTPYTHYDSGAESDDSRRCKSPAGQKQVLSWDVLQTKLDSVAAVRDAYPSSPSSHAETDHSDVEEEHKKEMHRMEFEEHRKRHYNEMELVRKYRQENTDEKADEDVTDEES